MLSVSLKPGKIDRSALTVELYNLYSYIEVVDEPDQFVYLWSAHYNNVDDAESDAWNETCLRYEEDAKEFHLPDYDEMIERLQEFERLRGRPDTIDKKMMDHAIELAIDARDDYIDYYAIAARLDDRDYEDLVVIDADEYNL